MLLIYALALVSGCATAQPTDEKKEQVRRCIKEMKTPDDNLRDVFEVCRQIYGLKKVKDNK